MDPQGLAPSSLPGFKANRLEACEHLRCGRVLVFEGTLFCGLKGKPKRKLRFWGSPMSMNTTNSVFSHREGVRSVSL